MSIERRTFEYALGGNEGPRIRVRDSHQTHMRMGFGGPCELALGKEGRYQSGIGSASGFWVRNELLELQEHAADR